MSKYKSRIQHRSRQPKESKSYYWNHDIIELWNIFVIIAVIIANLFISFSIILFNAMILLFVVYTYLFIASYFALFLL